LFGEIVPLPRIYTVFTKVLPVLDQKIEDIKPGDVIYVEWVPQEGCLVSVGFLKSPDNEGELPDTR
jgi:hypothetical protein